MVEVASRRPRPTDSEIQPAAQPRAAVRRTARDVDPACKSGPSRSSRKRASATWGIGAGEHPVGVDGVDIYADFGHRDARSPARGGNRRLGPTDKATDPPLLGDWVDAPGKKV
jgi:hypothetical protein